MFINYYNHSILIILDFVVIIMLSNLTFFLYKIKVWKLKPQTRNIFKVWKLKPQTRNIFKVF